MDETVPHGVWRGPGPQTQAAVFERTTAAPAAAAEGGGGGDGRLHEHGDAIVWQSRSKGAAFASLANEIAGPGAA